MNENDEVRKSPEVLPSIEELRKSQRQGSEGTGLPENNEYELNEVQGQEADIRE